MIRHVVMWKFKEGTEEQMNEFLTRLQALYGVIPQIKAQQVGRDIAGGGNYDAVLVSDFESLEDLEIYRVHPRHVAVGEFMGPVRESRSCVDFEL